MNHLNDLLNYRITFRMADILVSWVFMVFTQNYIETRKKKTLPKKKERLDKLCNITLYVI